MIDFSNLYLSIGVLTGIVIMVIFLTAYKLVFHYRDRSIARGKNLDRMGILWGVERNRFENDKNYRRRIRSQIENDVRTNYWELK